MSEPYIQCKIEGIVTVGVRGQFVLPKELRHKASIYANEKLAIIIFQDTDGPNLILTKTPTYKLK